MTSGTEEYMTNMIGRFTRTLVGGLALSALMAGAALAEDQITLTFTFG